jgi:hypothetical protein
LLQLWDLLLEVQTSRGVKKAALETEHMLHERKRQVSQLKQREPLEAQVEKAHQTDALASVDRPSDSSPASTGACDLLLCPDHNVLY